MWHTGTHSLAIPPRLRDGGRIGEARSPGADVAQELSAQPTWKAVPNIIVTGDATGIDPNRFACVLHPLELIDAVTKCLSAACSRAANGGGGGRSARIPSGIDPEGDGEILIDYQRNNRSWHDLPTVAHALVGKRERRFVEAAGVEPASESTSSWDSTCVSASMFSCPACGNG
jgi:hypothetical protein